MYTQVYKEGAKHTANFVIVPGLGEHAGRYLGIAKMLADFDLYVHMIDISGFGASGGGRSLSSFEDMQDDITFLFRQIDNELPIFLMGHSMGGGLVLNFIIANPSLKLAGVILNSPFYRFPGNVRLNFFKLRLINWLSRNVPEIVMSTKISINSITKDTEVIDSYKDDILLMSGITLKTVKTLLDVTIPLKTDKITINAPTIVFAGENDIVCEFIHTQQLFAKIQSPDKKFHSFPEGLHSPHCDFEFEEWANVLLDWTDHQTKLFQPTQQCNFIMLKVPVGKSNYYLWKNRVINFLIFSIIFYYLRKKRFSILKRILNL